MDNIIQLDILRVEKHKPRKCVCNPAMYTIDAKNREITCGCGVVHDPIQVLVNFADRYADVKDVEIAAHRRIENLKKEYEATRKQKPSGAVFLELEQQYNLGRMLPMCPQCGELFHFKDIKGWTSSIFYKPKKKG